MDINLIKGNALDLSMYKDETFDVTLVLGPLYHLFTKEDKEVLEPAIERAALAIEMYIGEMGFDDTVKFNFQAGSNTAKTTSYFKGAL